MHPNGGLERCIDFQIHTPFPVHGATGGALELHHDQNSEPIPTPVYCGGINQENFKTKDCFRLDQHQPLGTMLVRRMEAASVSIHNGTVLWVTGGLSDIESHHEVTSDSTEQLTVSADGQSLTSSESIPLPRALRSHCLVLLNNNLALLIGGFLGSLSPEWQFQVSDRSWSIDIDSFSLGWTERSSLTNARQKHVCGVIRDISHPKAKKIVMVAGGALDDTLTPTNSVELLQADNDDVSSQWQIGPSLPITLLDASSATTSDQKFLYVVGGREIELQQDQDPSTSIFMFYCDDSICEWKRLCMELSFGTHLSLALTLPSMDDSGSLVGKNEEALTEVIESCGEKERYSK